MLRERPPLCLALLAALLLHACSRPPEVPPFPPPAPPGAKNLDLIRSRIGRLEAPLAVTLWTGGDDPRGKETGMLLAKLENENPRFVLRRQGLAAEGAPLTLRTPEGKFHGPRIRVESPWGAGFDYLGYPADAELAAFLDSVLITSGLGPGLAPSTARTIASLPGEARIEVFVTPLCPMCADAFRLAAALAAHSPRIRLTVVNLAEFPELGKAYGVSVVPHIWINSRVSVVGAPPESYLASRIADAFHR